MPDKKKQIIASVDVGTNSFHLVIASVTGRSQLNIINREKETVRLGSGSRDMKYLQQDAIKRGVEAMKHFSELAESKNAEFIALATSAVREAENKLEFLNEVKQVTGREIQVISGTEEARLIYIGALHALPILNKKTLVIDIGGGSTETLIGLKGNALYAHSAKLGAIRLTSAFKLDTNRSKANIEASKEHIRGEWAHVINRLKEVGFDAVVGTSGTIFNIAVMAFLMTNPVVPDVINGMIVTKSQLLKVIDRIINAKNIKELSSIPGMDPSRADIILAGALILNHLILELNIKKISLSSYALREGAVFDYIQKKESLEEYHHLSNLRYDSVLTACKQFNVNFQHVEHVKMICLKLFDELQELHKLGNEARELLEAAAMLHDVGYHISLDQHHKHSYYIISQAFMPGFTIDESEVIANIARYHRKSHPKIKHENFSKLNQEKQNIVRILSGFLRIGEGLDRRQNQIVKDIRVVVTKKNIDIFISPLIENASLDIEIWGANRRKPLMEEALNMSVRFYQENV